MFLNEGEGTQCAISEQNKNHHLLSKIRSFINVITCACICRLPCISVI